MYVEFQIPATLKCNVPIVLFSGDLQSGLNYKGTPDGREGWEQFFLRKGYAVYTVDQPARGRSPNNLVDSETRIAPKERIERVFTAAGRSGLWPQATLHTQWPGSGVSGDETFDQYMDQTYPALVDIPLLQELNRDAGVALLERIGPAIILTHSQAGAYGWLIADARPDLVTAIVAIEPSGPPVHELVPPLASQEATGSASAGQGTGDAPQNEWYRDGRRTKPYGLAALPLAYDPPVTNENSLQFVKEEQAQRRDLSRGWKQVSPARQLAKLRTVPVLVVTGEASYHAAYDHLTVDYLRQAGVNTTFIRLAERGIFGNGHMMMLESNNLEIAAVIDE
jgi:pimeloyl-ACP methyl ester carboxylesterase